MSAVSDTGQERIPLVSLIAAIVAISVAGMGFGHSLPLFSFLLDSYGVSDEEIGLQTGVAAISALIGAPFYPRVIARIGLKPFLIICVLIMVIPYLAVFWAGERIWMWYPLRFIFSIGGAGLFAGSEIWINGLAPDRIRGKIIGIYATCLALGFAAGPFILATTGYDGFLPILVGATVFSSAVIPLFFASAPKFDGEHTSGIFAAMKTAPVIFGASAMFAGVESAVLIFLPVLALELNHGVAIGAQSVTVYGLGLLAAQLPVGQLADMFPARRVMTGCAAVGAALACLIPAVQEHVWALFAVLFVWGGAVGGIYTAGLVVIGNRYKGHELAAANTGFVFAYAAGAVIGPIAAGFVRGTLGPNGLLFAVGLSLALYAWAARRPSPRGA
ncbi:MFS transporter [Parvularcula lutaonensis]|uniref:MFS transporter n=1 Tax=Parvularcula lutaonensis TaxID=491923 RepID=A0ABV7MA27_9PROT|nr:MFS transporter [Parvularcula lutaonensis]GGY44798.1 MFS transporter [Parvularcula lutaonensis]